MKQFGKAFAKLLFSIVLVISLFSHSVYAYPTIFHINVPIVQQAKSNWCWAACGASLVNYCNGSSITQYNFSSTVKSNTTNNSTATMTELCNGLTHYGVHNHLISGIISFDTIQANSHGQSRPVLARWSWADSSLPGHVVVINGFDTSIGSYVMYMNPSASSYQVESYSYFVSNTYRHWTHTVDQIYSTLVSS